MTARLKFSLNSQINVVSVTENMHLELNLLRSNIFIGSVFKSISILVAPIT